MLVGFARALSKETDFTLANPAAAVLITWARYPEAKPNITDAKARLAQGVAILNSKMEGCVSPDVGEKHGLFIEKDWELLGQFLLQEQQLSKPVPASRMFTNEGDVSDLCRAVKVVSLVITDQLADPISKDGDVGLRP